MFLTPDYVHEPLYVVTTIFNPVRYKSRWKHYERFAQHIQAIGGVLVTVEAAFGERHHALDEGVSHHAQRTILPRRAPTDPTEFERTRTGHPHLYLPVRTTSEVWIKENLINLGVARLPSDWKYVAWVDADVQFARPNIIGETIHQLQHYKVVQMFSEAQDVGPRYASLGKSVGFGQQWVKGVPMPMVAQRDRGVYYGGERLERRAGQAAWHTGYAWAMRRDAWDELGGLIDFAALGSADNHMAHALVGEVERTINRELHPAYQAKLREWQFRAERHVRRNVGYVSGLLVHYWHGRKVDRRYRHRWRILTENQFNPDTDLKYDWQGVLQLVDRGDARSIKMRDEMRRYFRARNEDSIELDGVADET